PYVHVYGNRVICETDTRGYPTPGNKSLHEIVVDASAGFIPLWTKDTILRWRFQEHSMSFFADPESAKKAISNLVGEAVLRGVTPRLSNSLEATANGTLRLR